MTDLSNLNTGRNVLTTEQIRLFAPSVFSPHKHESRSKHFAHISTASVLLALEKEGFLPVKVNQSKSRDEGKREFTKHLVRFRHVNDLERQSRNVGDVFNEVILTNANDGLASYQFRVGKFRVVCLNGMVVGDKTMQFKVWHRGNEEDIGNKVIEAAYKATGLFDKIDQKEELMKARTLATEEQIEFAEKAFELRYGEETPYSPLLLLGARREEDAGNSLWLSYQRVQEKLINGGVRPDTRGRRQSRPIRRIDTNLRVNEALWNLAESYLN